MIASTYEYTVVQGDKFPFTTAEDDPLFWDKLHPTEEGYKVFAQSLKDELIEDVEDEEPDDPTEESTGIIENIKNSIAQINKTVSNSFASIKLKLQKLFSR